MRLGGQVELIGESGVIRELRAELERVAQSDAKVLLTGESGAGKEVVARAIHAASPRARGPFIAVNCAGIPETLLESELFGHVKGSFTGAYRDKPGKLEMAEDGTLFLDEIGEMTLRMQGLLLRYLETGEIQKVGAERVARVTNVRIMTATNKDLFDLQGKGQFREDLFYRINVIHIVVPPVRERREDIPLLIEHFLQRHTRRAEPGDGASAPVPAGAAAIRGENGDGGDRRNGGGYHSPVRSISPEAIEALTRYDWPGNVRQIENVIERMVVTGRNDVIRVTDLSAEIRTAAVHGGNGRDQRKSVADELFTKLVEERQCFWQAVYPLYMNREITRGNVRELVHRGLEEARGNYKIVLRLFNMESSDYKRFLNFLRKHDCQLPFKAYR
jgi:two-component system NtrC family response regulator